MVLLAARIATIVRRGFEEIIHHHLMTKLMILRVELDISEDILLVTILQSFWWARVEHQNIRINLLNFFIVAYI